MKFLVSLLPLLALLLCNLLQSGCVPAGRSQIEEQKEPYFVAGKSRENTMDYAGAVECFEKAINANPKSASAHLELGWLFGKMVPDPAAAIYHYERYLRLCPTSNQSGTIRQLILACKQELARSVSLGPITEKQQRDLEKLVKDNQRLAELNKQLSDEVSKWRAYCAAHPLVVTSQTARTTAPPGMVQIGPPTRPELTPVGQTAGLPGAVAPVRTNLQPGLLAQPGARGAPGTNALHPPMPAVVPAGPLTPPQATNPASRPLTAVPPRPPSADPTRTHRVKERETLASIAKQHNVKWEALLAANPGLSPRHLRPGQVLNVPAR